LRWYLVGLTCLKGQADVGKKANAEILFFPPLCAGQLDRSVARSAGPVPTG
jgi:hypothetical protein